MAACSICGSTNLKKLFSLGDIPLCDNYSQSIEEAKDQKLYPISVFNCLDCGHGELEFKAPEQEIYSEYIYRTSESPGLVSHFQEYAESVSSLYSRYFNINLKNKQSLKSLDIGGNDGVLADCLSKCGFNSTVLDPSPAVKFCPDHVNSIQDYLSIDTASKLKISTGSYQLITANNVIANIRDIHGFFGGLHELLDQDSGMIVLESGNFPLMLTNNVVEMFNHEHYHYFSYSSLSKLCKQHGLRITDFCCTGSKGGSFRCVIVNASNLACPSFTPLTNYEDLIFQRDFTLSSKKLLESLQAQRVKINRLSSPIVGFGAYAGGTILTYALGLENKIELLIDDNSSRHGLYSPSAAIRVAEPSAIRSLSNPSLVILAWRFNDMILKKHQEIFSRCKDVVSLF